MLLRSRRRPFFLLLASIPLTLYLFLNHTPTMQELKTSIFYRLYPDQSLYCYGPSQNQLYTSALLSETVVHQQLERQQLEQQQQLEQHLLQQSTDGGSDERRATLPDFVEYRPRADGKGIFFFETSCASYKHGRVFITARQACAVESAAKMNPGMDVYLVYMAPGIISSTPTTPSDRALHSLLNHYPNIHLLHLNFASYLQSSPLHHLYTTPSKLPASSHIQSHASDLLRYLTLARYGGVYLDLDVVVIRPLGGDDLIGGGGGGGGGGNWAGAESEANVAAGVMRFGVDEVGKKLAEECVGDLGRNYQASGWGTNGPGVITRLARKLCNADQAVHMTHCRNFTVFAPPYFYPVAWWNWTMYFDPDQMQRVFHLAKDSYAIHVWNKHSSGTRIDVRGRPTAYGTFARTFCPRVYATCDTWF